jgi:transcription antitermination factor NusG
MNVEKSRNSGDGGASSMFSQQANSNFTIAGTGTLNDYCLGPLTCDSDQGTLEWKAAYTRQHHEKSVARHLSEVGVECFLPFYMEERHWSNNRRPILEMPLFPNYLFVRVSPQSRIRVLKAPGVIDIVGRNSVTDRITDEEIEVLRSGLPLRKPKPHPFVLGENVRIVRGPLSSLEGVVLRQKGTLRVVITVPLIRQSVSVEIAAAELEPLCRISTCRSVSQ